MEKENVGKGKGKERVLREKICNRVLEEQNMEKENVGRGRGRVLLDKFCNHVSKSFHNGSKVEKALGLDFMVELNA